MGVEEWANCRRGRVRESKCGMMCLTQEQPLLPPIKEERLLPTKSVHYTQQGRVSENIVVLGNPVNKGKRRAGVAISNPGPPHVAYSPYAALLGWLLTFF